VAHAEEVKDHTKAPPTKEEFTTLIDPIEDHDEMIWRLEYVEDIFEDFEWFVEEFIPILEEDGEDWDYYIHT